MNLRPSFSDPEYAVMKDDLRKVFDELARKKLIPVIPEPELIKALDELAPALVLLKKNDPKQFRELMELIKTTQVELIKNPDLQRTLTKLKLNLDNLVNKLEAERKITPEFAHRFRKDYQEKALELEKHLQAKKQDPRPIGGDPAFAKLFLDYLTLTLINEFNFDPRNNMYRFTISTIFPNYGGYDDPSPEYGGDALSKLQHPDLGQTGIQGAVDTPKEIKIVQEQEEKKAQHTSSLPNPLSTRPKPPGTGSSNG